MARVAIAPVRTVDAFDTPCLDCGSIDYEVSYPECDVVCRECGLVNAGANEGVTSSGCGPSTHGPHHLPHHMPCLEHQQRGGAGRPAMRAMLRDVPRFAVDEYNALVDDLARVRVIATTAHIHHVACLYIVLGAYGRVDTIEAFSARCGGVDHRSLARVVQNILVSIQEHSGTLSEATTRLASGSNDKLTMHVARLVNTCFDCIIDTLRDDGQASILDSVRAPVKFKVIDIVHSIRRSDNHLFQRKHLNAIVGGTTKYALFHSRLCGPIMTRSLRRAAGAALTSTFWVSHPSMDRIVSFVRSLDASSPDDDDDDDDDDVEDENDDVGATAITSTACNNHHIPPVPSSPDMSYYATDDDDIAIPTH